MINGLSIIQQEEILADLNSLGRYQRIRHFRGEPVEISAYIVNTGGGGDNPGSSTIDSGHSQANFPYSIEL